MLVQFSKKKYYFSDVLSDSITITYNEPLRISTEFFEDARRDQESFLKYIWALKYHMPYLYWLMVLGSTNSLVQLKMIIGDKISIIDNYDTSLIDDYVRRSRLYQIFKIMSETFADNTNNWLKIEDFLNFICSASQTNEFELMKNVLHQSLEYGEIFVKYANYIKENNLLIYQDHYRFIKDLSLPKTPEIASEFLENTELFFNWLEYANGEEVIWLSSKCDLYYNWNKFAYSITDNSKTINTNLKGEHYLLIDNNIIIATISLENAPKVFVVSPKFINQLPIKTLADWRITKTNDNVVLIVRTDEIAAIREDI